MQYCQYKEIAGYSYIYRDTLTHSTLPTCTRSGAAKSTSTVNGTAPLPPHSIPPWSAAKNGISACHCRLVILDICISFAALQSPSTLYTRHHMPHSFSMSVASLRDYTSTHKVPQPSIHRLKHFSPISCMYLVSKLSTSILH